MTNPGYCYLKNISILYFKRSFLVMKRVVFLLCLFVFTASVFVSCNKEKEAKPAETVSNYDDSENEEITPKSEEDDIDLFSQAMNAIEESGSSLFDSIMEDFAEAAEDVAESNAEIADAVNEAVEEAAEEVNEDLSDLLNQLEDSSSSWF